MIDHETILRAMACTHISQARSNRQWPSIADEHERFMAACLAGAEALRDAKEIAQAVHYYTGEDVDVLVQRYRDDQPAMMPSPTEPPR